MKIHFVAVLLASLFAGMTWPERATAQDGSLDLIIRENSVYIYHDRPMSRHDGFNIYRRSDTEDEFTRLNETPVRKVQRSDELLSVIGNETFEEIRGTLRQPNLVTTFLKLRRDDFIRTTMESIFPELARAMGSLFIDTDPPIEETVTYRIEFLDEHDRPTGETISETRLLSPFRVHAPSGLEAENDRRRITLSWHFPLESGERYEYAIRFNVYRLNPETGEPERLNDRILYRNFEEEKYRFNYRAVSLNTVEQVFIRSVDPSGQESDRSELLEIEVIDRTPPSIVRDVNARVTRNDFIQVTWPLSVDPDVIGYNIYRAKSHTEEFKQLNDDPIDILNTVYLDTTVVGRNSYFYRISAIDASGNESEPSNAAMAIVERRPPPPTPHSLRAEFHEEDHTVELRWGVDSIPPELETFIVLRRRADVAEDRPFTQVQFEALRDTVLIDDGDQDGLLREGATFQYAVVSSDYARTFSDTAFAKIQIPNITPPDPPRNVRVINDQGFRALLTWNATLSEDADHYLVYRKQTGDEEFDLVDRLAVRERRLRDESVDVGKSYRYAVSAVDTSGNESDWAMTDVFTVRSSAPPRGVRNVQARMTDDGVELAWEEVKSRHIKGYIVYRSDIPTGVYEPVHSEVLTDTRFIDPEGAEEHWYRVRAVNSSGLESRRAQEIRPGR